MDINNALKKKETYHDRGIAYYDKENYKKSLEYFIKEHAIIKKIRENHYVLRESEIISVHHYLGRCHYQLDQQQEALLQLNKCERICERLLEINEISDFLFIALGMNWGYKGSVYNEIKEFDKAIDCLEKSVNFFNRTEIRESRFIRENIAFTYLGMASVYRQLNNDQKAQEYDNKRKEYLDN